MKRIIGLTGGIATGKSTVSGYLDQHYSMTILDADHLARAATAPTSPLFRPLTQHFGSAILAPDGTLNRPRLAQIIFSQAPERRWLEALIHPFVRDRLTQARQNFLSYPNPTPQPHPQGLPPILVMVIPLLFEADMVDLVTEIWVVSCDRVLQIRRLMERNALSYEQAQERIHSQWPLREKINRADVVLDNNGTLEALYRQVDQALLHFPETTQP
ncbi:dephospho-CoA kinase [Lyngbya confervoides]|uniref:Dephospho-CoA kinase n=1 Tax=Lyngbya confervoides BDU141951 TaxID=1574623 RepID=A0ABD4T1J8_9CYAN|nr:dephospho-CoA kinase [Lyngbya confervoides]MCM1982475.1 dephospho-CoA kinase [Lyngbya confervoides BDU141951]